MTTHPALAGPPASKELSVPAQILEDGGPKLWSEFMEELRHLHLGAPQPKATVLALGSQLLRPPHGCSRPGTKPPSRAR